MKWTKHLHQVLHPRPRKISFQFPTEQEVHFLKCFLWINVLAIAELSVLIFSFPLIHGKCGGGENLQNSFFGPGGKAVANQLEGYIVFCRCAQAFFQTGYKVTVLVLPAWINHYWSDNKSQGVTGGRHLCRGLQAFINAGCAVLVLFYHPLGVDAEPEPGVAPVVGIKQGVHLGVLGNETEAAQFPGAEELNGPFKGSGVSFRRDGVRGGRPFKDGDFRGLFLYVCLCRRQNFIDINVYTEVRPVAQCCMQVAVFTFAAAACAKGQLVMGRRLASLKLKGSSYTHHQGALGLKIGLPGGLSRNFGYPVMAGRQADRDAFTGELPVQFFPQRVFKGVPFKEYTSRHKSHKNPLRELYYPHRGINMN